MELDLAPARADALGFATLGAIDTLAAPSRGTADLVCGDAQVRIDALSDAVLRIRLVAPGGELAHDGSYALDPEADWSGPTAWSATLDETGLRIETAELVVTSPREALRLRVETRGGVGLVQETSGAAWRDGRWAHAVELAPQDRLFGLGDKALTVDRRGHAVEMWNTDAYQYQRGTDPLYKSVPFVLRLAEAGAVGLFYDSVPRTRLDLGAADATELRAEAEGVLDLYVLAPPAGDPGSGPGQAPEPLAVTRQLARLTGRTPMLPRWALGYHQCRYSYRTEAEVREVAREFRQRRIPCDTLYFDIHYMDGYRVFTWDREAFPDPDGLLADLRADGFTSVVIVDPGVKADDPDYAVYRQGAELDAYARYPDGEDGAPGEVALGHVWPGLCAFPDFTRADVRDWWGGLHAELLAQGVDGIWNDMNEPAVFEVEHVDGSMDSEGTAGTLPDDVRFALDGRGGSHLEAHNVYGMQMQRATHEGLARLAPERRPFTITRAAYAGAQRFGTGWTGDNSATWDHLRLAASTVLSLGVSGMPFTGADVGGFSGVPTGELLARWTQLGAFTPLFRNHSAIDTPRQEPWLFGEEVERVCREAIELRYRLLPVLYTALYQAATEGTPILRPLALVHPDDPTVRSTAPLAFYCGPDLLVHPVVEAGQTEREIYLPENAGGWVDLLTGERHAGRSTIWIETPLDRIPVFLRAGAVVPLAPVRQHTHEPVDRLELHVVPAPGTHTSRLFDDAGDGHGYRHGDAWDGRLRLTDDGTRVTLETEADGSFEPTWAAWDLVVHGLDAAPASVTADGDVVQAVFEEGALRLSVPRGARAEIVR